MEPLREPASSRIRRSRSACCACRHQGAAPGRTATPTAQSRFKPDLAPSRYRAMAAASHCSSSPPAASVGASRRRRSTAARPTPPAAIGLCLVDGPSGDSDHRPRSCRPRPAGQGSSPWWQSAASGFEARCARRCCHQAEPQSASTAAARLSVVPIVRRQCRPSPASRPRLQSRQFPAHVGDSRADQGLVADQPEGEADQDRREGGPTAAMSPSRWPRLPCRGCCSPRSCG